MAQPEIAPMAARSEVDQPPFDAFWRDAIDFVCDKPVFMIAEMYQYLSGRHNLGMDLTTFREFFFDELQPVIEGRLKERTPQWMSAACPNGKVYYGLDMLHDKKVPTEDLALENAVRAELRSLFAGRAMIEEDELLFYLSVLQGLGPQAFQVCEMLLDAEIMVKMGAMYTLPQRAHLDEGIDTLAVTESKIEIKEVALPPEPEPLPESPPVKEQPEPIPKPAEAPAPTPAKTSSPRKAPKPAAAASQVVSAKRSSSPPASKAAPVHRRVVSVAQAVEEPPVAVKEKKPAAPVGVEPGGEPKFMFPPAEKQVDTPMLPPERSTALQALKRLSWRTAREQGVDLEALINYVISPGVNHVIAKNTIIRLWRRGIVWLDLRAPEAPRIFLPKGEPTDERESEIRRGKILASLTQSFATEPTSAQ